MEDTLKKFWSIYEKGQLAAASAITELFCDKCSVLETTEKTTEWGETITVFEIIQADLPCRLSYESKTCQQEGRFLSMSVWQPTLFYCNDVEILPGSRVTVTTARGRVLQFTAAGESAVFPTHNEVRLKGFYEV